MPWDRSTVGEPYAGNPHVRFDEEEQAALVAACSLLSWVNKGDGGRTTLENETTLCAVCHSLKTLGYLEIRGNAADGLTFHAREGEEFSERSENSRRSEWRDRFEHLASGLENLGYTKKEASERLET